MTIGSSENNIDEVSVLQQFKNVVNSNTQTSAYTTLSDSVLLKFLRSRDFNVDQSYKVLTSYIEIINNRPDLFTWSDGIENACQLMIYYHYPIRKDNGEKVIIVHPGRWIPRQLTFESLLKVAILMTEISLMEDETQRSGVSVVIDMRDFGWSQIYHCGTSNAKLASYLTDHCFPSNIKGIHVVHENRLTDIGYALFKPFLDAKLKERIHFHGHCLDNLYQFVPKPCLPESFGGDGKNFSGEYFIQLIKQNYQTIQDYWKLFQKKSN